MKKDKCKYCKKTATYSFGWVDSNNQWHDKYFTCDKHSQLALMKQSLALKCEEISERIKRSFSI